MRKNTMASVENELRQILAGKSSFSTLRKKIDTMLDENKDNPDAVMEKIALYGIVLCRDELKKTGQVHPAA